MDIVKGCIVRSGAGHDKGRFMLVLDISPGYAFVVDGKERKIDKPKRKNVKHLFPTKTQVELDKFETDAAIRRLLWKYNNKQ